MAKNTPTKSVATKAKAPSKPAAKTNCPAAAKDGSKAAAIIALLRREGGTTLDEMMNATGWQKHSVRGFIAGALKKQYGLTVSSEKTDLGRAYRITVEVRQ